MDRNRHRNKTLRLCSFNCQSASIIRVGRDGRLDSPIVVIVLHDGMSVEEPRVESAHVSEEVVSVPQTSCDLQTDLYDSEPP